MAPDPYRYFRIEARELAEQLGQGLLDLEKRPSVELISGLLRLAHTLKGAARVVKQGEIADRAHAIEDVLTPYRDREAPLPAEHLARLLGLVDEVADRAAALAVAGDAAPRAGAATARDPVADAAGDSIRRRDPAIEPPPTPQIDTADLDELVDAIGEAHSQLVPLRRGITGVARARRAAELVAELLAAPTRGATATTTDDAGHRARSIVTELGDELAAITRALARTAEATERELGQVRGCAERLRLVPAATIFTVLRRAVRDAAQAQGKDVRFEAVGGDVRLDPQVLSAAYNALLHIVRNAVAHGVETEPDRRTAGKPAQGSIVVEVARRGRRVAFICRDDGRGFDLDAARRAAERRGVPVAGSDDQQMVELLLRGGISTSGTVTEVSGRGIGLDVVRDVAERLGGEVAVTTDAGRGATVELLLPVSVVALDALVIEADGVAAAIPLDCVRHTMRLRPEEIASSAAGATVCYADQAIPYLRLSHLDPARRVPAPASRGPARPGHAVVAVVVAGAAGFAAIGVDRLAGTAEVVVRPLPDLAPAAAVVGGTSLDVEGNPRVVLDPDGLVATARQPGGERSAGPVETPRPILVIDDSLTTRVLEQSILESAGYEVDVAGSGEEALEKARASHYSLFLVDIEMPGMDGFTFIERTRADPALRDIPSILVSSRSSAEDRRRGAEAGARMHVGKGEFDQNELLEHIGHLVGGA